MASKLSAMLLPGDDNDCKLQSNRAKAWGLSSDLAYRAVQDGANDKSNVRFADRVEDIRPEPSEPIRDLKQAQDEAELEEMTPEAREEIRRLAVSQQKSRLQEQRAAHFAYDTFSLPASRVSNACRFPDRKHTGGMS